MGQVFPAAQIDLLIDYLGLLVKWNKTYNLTAIKDPAKMISHHLLDSLAVYPWLKGESFADIGTGAGLPGIPLAIVMPEKSFQLVDSNGKKTRFLFEVKHRLSLANVTVVQARCEDVKGSFDGIISRAFADIATMLQVSEHLLSKGGSFFAMKGRYPEDELQHLPVQYQLNRVLDLSVPQMDEARHLVQINLIENKTGKPF